MTQGHTLHRTGWPLTGICCHVQEMQQRLSVPQQQAVAAGFDEFVTSVRSAVLQFTTSNH